MSVAYCALTHQAYWVAEPSGWWWNRVTCHVSAIDGNLVRFPGTAPDDRQAAAGADSEADPDHDAGIAVQHHEGRTVRRAVHQRGWPAPPEAVLVLVPSAVLVRQPVMAVECHVIAAALLSHHPSPRCPNCPRHSGAPQPAGPGCH